MSMHSLTHMQHLWPWDTYLPPTPHRVVMDNETKHLDHRVWLNGSREQWKHRPRTKKAFILWSDGIVHKHCGEGAVHLQESGTMVRCRQGNTCLFDCFIYVRCIFWSVIDGLLAFCCVHQYGKILAFCSQSRGGLVSGLFGRGRVGVLAVINAMAIAAYGAVSSVPHSVMLLLLFSGVYRL